MPITDDNNLNCYIMCQARALRKIRHRNDFDGATEKKFDFGIMLAHMITGFGMIKHG